MPWKECHVVDERLQFIARLLDGETMSRLCEEFGISRKTGYKIFERYQDYGVQGLTDRCRRPVSPRQPAAADDREADCSAQARVSRTGGRRRSANGSGRAVRMCGGPRSPRSMRSSTGTAWSSAAGRGAAGDRDCSVDRRRAKRPLVCRLQGRVHARRPALLLSAYHHRLREPVSARRARPCPPRRRLTPSGCSTRVSRIRPASARSAPIMASPSPPHALFGLIKLSVWWLRLGIRSRTHQARPP